MRKSCMLVLSSLLSVILLAPLEAQAPAKSDAWAPLQFLVGEWNGTTEGQPGKGTVKRTYEWVLNGRFLREVNISTYPQQEKNPKGEVHEHWTMFSYDRGRKMLVMRQFHIEGFVNQYVLPQGSASVDGFVFESEAFENLPSGWKAREKYQRITKDEFVEVFELAAPGKPFEVYSRNHFRRRPPTS
jgi:hypothetical protein